MPVVDLIGAKLSAVDECSAPSAPDTNYNSLFLGFGLTLAGGS
jgi:hypothetical protein